MWEFLNLWSFIMQLINISIIIYVLNRFLFKPYMAFIKEEDKKRTEMEYAYNNLDLLKEEANKEATLIIEEAKNTALVEREKITEFANNEKNRIINEAIAESKTIISNADKESEQMKSSMMQSVKSDVLNLSLRLISKIFGKEAVNKDFLERELEVLNK